MSKHTSAEDKLHVYTRQIVRNTQPTPKTYNAPQIPNRPKTNSKNQYR